MVAVSKYVWDYTIYDRRGFICHILHFTRPHIVSTLVVLYLRSLCRTRRKRFSPFPPHFRTVSVWSPPQLHIIYTIVLRATLHGIVSLQHVCITHGTVKFPSTWHDVQTFLKLDYHSDLADIVRLQVCGLHQPPSSFSVLPLESLSHLRITHTCRPCPHSLTGTNKSCYPYHLCTEYYSACGI